MSEKTRQLSKFKCILKGWWNYPASTHLGTDVLLITRVWPLAGSFAIADRAPCSLRWVVPKSMLSYSRHSSLTFLLPQSDNIYFLWKIWTDWLIIVAHSQFIVKQVSPFFLLEISDRNMAIRFFVLSQYEIRIQNYLPRSFIVRLCCHPQFVYCRFDHTFYGTIILQLISNWLVASWYMDKTESCFQAW